MNTFVISGFAGTGRPGPSGDGGAANNAELYGPYGLFIDSSNNLYICDLFNYKIRKVNIAGSNNKITTIAGNGNKKYGGDGAAATLASFFFPKGIVADSSGNMYVADSEGSRVRIIRAVSNIITTLVGDGIYGYNGDSIASTSARLNFPRGLAIDTHDNVYIADAKNNRIRMVNQATKLITTVAGNGDIGIGMMHPLPPPSSPPPAPPPPHSLIILISTSFSYHHHHSPLLSSPQSSLCRLLVVRRRRRTSHKRPVKSTRRSRR